MTCASSRTRSRASTPFSACPKACSGSGSTGRTPRWCDWSRNYRSTKSIVAVARRLVGPYAPVLGALDLKLDREPSQHARRGCGVARTRRKKRTPSRTWRANSGEDIAHRRDRHPRAKSCAQARPIEAALLRAGVPYVLAGGVRFYARGGNEGRAGLPARGAAARRHRVVLAHRQHAPPGPGTRRRCSPLRATRSTAAGRSPSAQALGGDGRTDGLYDLLAPPGTNYSGWPAPAPGRDCCWRRRCG